jgi:hypothetical protein
MSAVPINECVVYVSFTESVVTQNVIEGNHFATGVVAQLAQHLQGAGSMCGVVRHGDLAVTIFSKDNPTSCFAVKALADVDSR